MAHRDPTFTQARSPKSEDPKLPRRWREAFELVLRESDAVALFKRVEVAEAAILTRRYDLQQGGFNYEEHCEIEAALDHLRTIKRDRLGFDDLPASQRGHGAKSGDSAMQPDES